MKLKSLYEFYREYFDYPKSSNRYYGRAVGEMSRIAREVMRKKSTMPMHDYLHGRYCNSATKDMIKKLLWIAVNSYGDPFKEVYYFSTVINIDKDLISSKHRGIQIPLECGIDYSSNKLIIPVYGSKYNISKENCVLKGLINEFSLTEKIPIDVSTVAYWNLSKGEVDEVDFESLQPAGRSSLIKTANKIT